MGDFTFRYRLKLAPRSSIDGEAHRVILLQRSDGRTVELASPDAETPLSKARELVLRASGWQTSEEAERHGSDHRDALTLALMRHRIGTYPVAVAPKGRFYPVALRAMEGKMGVPVVNDSYELMVFETEPAPRFAFVGPATVIMSIDTIRLGATFGALSAYSLVLSDRERLAIDLFNTSFLEMSSVTRLLTLVMAVEALLELRPRSANAIALVERLISDVDGSEDISLGEKDGLRGSLQYLRRESISSAGRALARSRLGDRRYCDLTPDEFFRACYEMRSRLVHGSEPSPDYADVGRLAATLEVFVSDLITEPFIPLEGA